MHVFLRCVVQLIRAFEHKYVNKGHTTQFLIRFVDKRDYFRKTVVLLWRFAKNVLHAPLYVTFLLLLFKFVLFLNLSIFCFIFGLNSTPAQYTPYSMAWKKAQNERPQPKFCLVWPHNRVT